MTQESIKNKARKMAQKCVECPVCIKARETQKGLAYWFVKYIDIHICPFCKAYERVYGRKAYEPVTTE